MNRVRSDRPAGSAASHRCGPQRTLRTQSDASRCPSAVAGTTQPQRLRRRPAGASRASAMTGCLLPRALHSRRSAPLARMRLLTGGPARPRLASDAIAPNDGGARSVCGSAGVRGWEGPGYSGAIFGHPCLRRSGHYVRMAVCRLTRVCGQDSPVSKVITSTMYGVVAGGGASTTRRNIRRRHRFAGDPV
jgi:hypothetical protein